MTIDTQPTSTISFLDLSLNSKILQALKAMKFESPTQIQAQSLPITLTGKDLIACSQTGTGKTAAFCIPMVEHLLKNTQKQALILTPTRELAFQITDFLRLLLKYLPELSVALVIGGSQFDRQKKRLFSKPSIIVATPGRLNDHLGRKGTLMKDVNFLVLDEADRMLDMGFAPQLETILARLTAQRQTLLFSATMPLPIQKMAEKFMLKPESITVGANTRPVEKIRQEIIATDMVSKDNLLKDHLNKIEGSVIIFARTQRRTDRLNYLLSQDGYSVSAIHGGRTQGQRNAAIKGFRSGAYRILVATDIAARGLDIPDISHVINYDIPLLAEDYVHRIGRTGRAGAEGHAISFVIPDEFRLWNRIHKSTAGVPALDKNSAASISTSDNRDKNQGKNKNSNFRSRFNKFRGRSSAKKKEGGWKGGFPSRNSGASSQRSSESHRPKH